jgi:DNA-binding beta-propeller fold protein YncE
MSVLPAGYAVEAHAESSAAGRQACQPGAYVSISLGRVRPVNFVTRKVGKPIWMPMPGIRRSAGPITITPDGKTAYVYTHSNEGSWLTSINIATRKTGIPLPLLDFQWGLMAVTANSKNLYLAGRDVSLINPPANTIAKEITFPHKGVVSHFYLTASGATLYAQGIGSLTPISTSANTPGPVIALPFTPGVNPYGMAITPNGKTAYLANWNASTVVPLDLATGVAGPPIKPVGLQPNQIVITPNGSTAYVEAADSGIVTPISTKTNTVGKAIKIGGTMALTPNGKTLFVLGQYSITPISTKTDKIGKPIKISTGGMAFTPDSKTAWVIAGNSIVPINLATDKAGKPIAIPGGPGTITLKTCPPARA